MPQDVASPTISTDTGLEAAQMAGQIAAQEEIEWVIAGGIAMHLYGSPAKLVTENLQKEALTLI